MDAPAEPGRYPTAVRDTGTGSAVLLLHGTAPGTTAAGNFAQLIPALTDHYVLAPDLLRRRQQAPRRRLRHPAVG